MKILYLAILVTCCLTLPTFARTADMEKEAQKYIRSLLREVPELAGTKNARDAREIILADYKRKDVLQLSAAMREKIEDRENPVPDPDYAAVIAKTKDIKQTKEVKFLLENALDKNVDSELRLLLFRLMELHIETDEDIRKNNLSQLLDASRAYKAQHNKYATNLTDLSLSPDIAKFIDKFGKPHNWLYLGGTKKGISRKSSRLIFVEPIPNSAGTVLSINSRGSKTEINLATLKTEITNLAKEKSPIPKPKSTTSEVAEYSPILNNQMKELLLAHLAYTVKNKKSPSTIEDLNLPPYLTKSTSPDNTTTAAWIFIPPNKTINIGKKKVLIASPFPHDGKNHLIATDDGLINTISSADFKKILAKLKK